MKTLKTFPLIFSFIFSTAAKATDDLCAYEKELPSHSEISQGDFKAFLFSGQNVDQILISKSQRRLYLIKGSQVIKSYATAFGDPDGPKQFEGDQKTPEGLYFIESKNPNSQFHRGLKISYPNPDDIAYAKKQGKSPGGEIMIHGFPNDPDSKNFVRQFHPMNWTQGCVAVTDAEIEEIYSLVEVGTPTTLCPL